MKNYIKKAIILSFLMFLGVFLSGCIFSNTEKQETFHNHVLNKTIANEVTYNDAVQLKLIKFSTTEDIIITTHGESGVQTENAKYVVDEKNKKLEITENNIVKAYSYELSEYGVALNDGVNGVMFRFFSAKTDISGKYYDAYEDLFVIVNFTEPEKMLKTQHYNSVHEGDIVLGVEETEEYDYFVFENTIVLYDKEDNTKPNIVSRFESEDDFIIVDTYTYHVAKTEVEGEYYDFAESHIGIWNFSSNGEVDYQETDFVREEQLDIDASITYFTFKNFIVLNFEYEEDGELKQHFTWEFFVYGEEFIEMYSNNKVMYKGYTNLEGDYYQSDKNFIKKWSFDNEGNVNLKTTVLVETDDEKEISEFEIDVNYRVWGEHLVVFGENDGDYIYEKRSFIFDDNNININESLLSQAQPNFEGAYLLEDDKLNKKTTYNFYLDGSAVVEIIEYNENAEIISTKIYNYKYVILEGYLSMVCVEEDIINKEKIEFFGEFITIGEKYLTKS